MLSSTGVGLAMSNFPDHALCCWLCEDTELLAAENAATVTEYLQKIAEVPVPDRAPRTPWQEVMTDGCSARLGSLSKKFMVMLGDEAESASSARLPTPQTPSLPSPGKHLHSLMAKLPSLCPVLDPTLWGLVMLTVPGFSMKSNTWANAWGQPGAMATGCFHLVWAGTGVSLQLESCRMSSGRMPADCMAIRSCMKTRSCMEDELCM